MCHLLIYISFRQVRFSNVKKVFIKLGLQVKGDG